MIETLSFPIVILAFITGVILLVSWNWRISIGSLAVQYCCVFVLVAISWPVETAAVKLVAGLMASAVLGLALFNLPKDLANQNRLATPEVVFRVIAALLAGLLVITSGTKLVEWFPEISVEQAYGSLILITLGLIQLGLTQHPLRVVIGLLTVLSGFGIIQAGIESSILITGLLAVITLSLSVVGAYMLTAAILEETS